MSLLDTFLYSLKDFAPFAEPFTGVLLKLFNQTKKILANAASDTAFVLIARLETPKLIPSYCATLADKNKDGQCHPSIQLRPSLTPLSER